MIEIRWHGRGGQGTKTASLMLADILFVLGKYVQGFPEYGPERTGAPLTAFNRFDDKKIRVHSNIYNPDYVVIVDETQINNDTIKGLKENGILVLNTGLTETEIRKKITLLQTQKIYTLDATNISKEILGKVFPNIPMLTAILMILQKQEYIENKEEIVGQKIIDILHQEISIKFSDNTELIEKNMLCVKKVIEIFNNKNI